MPWNVPAAAIRSRWARIRASEAERLSVGPELGPRSVRQSSLIRMTRSENPTNQKRVNIRPICRAEWLRKLVRRRRRGCRIRLQNVHNGLAGRSGSEIAADIPGRTAALHGEGNRVLDGSTRLLEPRFTPALAMPAEQQCSRQDQREWIGDVTPGNIGRGTVRGLRHGIFRADIERAAEAETPRQLRRQVR